MCVLGPLRTSASETTTRAGYGMVCPCAFKARARSSIMPERVRAVRINALLRLGRARVVILLSVVRMGRNEGDPRLGRGDGFSPDGIVGWGGREGAPIVG